MGNLTFKGGVHPFEGKELSKDKPVKPYLPTGDLVYPLSQHIGAPANPVVAKGDHVLAGQLIAEAGGFVSAPIYASVSGTVKAIEPRRNATSTMVPSIIIENDGEYKSVEFNAVDDPFSLPREEILERIKTAGIVGMGGAGFPTHVKLSPKEPDKIDYIIANCAECEPYLTSDYRLMLDEPEALVGGMKLMVSLFDNAQGIIAIEDNKPDCIKLISELVKDEPKVCVKQVMTKYPQGSERQMIYATTGREINSSMLPADAGCIVDNTATIINVFKAVKEGKPLTHRVVTVTGDAIEDPRNFDVLFGTNFAELIEAAGGFKNEPEKIISGGPMMGFAVFDTNFPVVKNTSSILCLSHDEVAATEPTACINCGRCVEVCPSRLIPSRLSKLMDHGDIETFEKMNGVECVECGSCSFICPAKRHLAQSIRAGRQTVLANRRKKK
ncbi:MAG: electron transport complex subunit RsxC [Lachnospiraceae bacterium]|nr:electron transport complex subunit RsxC [Lachnospiraceae bacterium]